jgi:2'-hydroxyisoflavone reductase
MNILIIGGTIFLGRHIVEVAIRRGHTPTIFHRGKHNPHLFPDVEKLHGDRRSNVSALRGRTWDAVIDTCGYIQQDIRTVGAALKDATEHYTYISSISVYNDMSPRAITEDASVGELENPDTEEITGETYGPLKALCERTAEEYFPGKTCVVRPGLIVGPDDFTNRFAYWPRRVARGGGMLAPGEPDQPVQFIDVRDLAEWIVLMAEQRQTGVFNATGPEHRITMAQFLDTCRTALEADTRPVWMDDAFLLEQHVAPFTELPLWVPADSAGIHMVDCSRAIEAGLRFRPTEEVVRDTWAWDKANAEVAARSPHQPLTAEREAELLKQWEQRTA